MEIHSNQPAAGNAGAEKSLGEAKKDSDPDGSDTDSIIYTPEGSDEEGEGQEDERQEDERQEPWGNGQHCPIM